MRRRNSREASVSPEGRIDPQAAGGVGESLSWHSAVSEAEDKRWASSFVMGLPSGAKYWFSGCPNRIMYKVSPSNHSWVGMFWLGLA
jgi:hypothetical protein